jgi:plasmid stabilization system protein ParE
VRIVFLPTTRQDLAWFRRYYQSVFPDGDLTAKRHYQQTKLLLSTNPYAGHALGDGELRELTVLKTPFAFLYRIRDDRIEVVRLWDQRRAWMVDPGQ